MTQFVAVSLSAGKRPYTYQNSTGTPLGVGDKVKLPAPRGAEGWISGIVEAVDQPEPSFACKPVIEIIETAADRAARKEGPSE